MSERTFEYNEATRGGDQLLISLVGPSWSGKTFSALRLATGLQRVVGGDIACLDTEGQRARRYADTFRFHHMPFSPPFDPKSYEEGLHQAVAKGAKVIIIDSGSHCWEGPGGVHDMQEDYLQKKAGDDWKKRDRYNFAAWKVAKAPYQRLVNTMTQLPVHMIWCFRAKRRLEIKKGEDPRELGYVSIAGNEMKWEFEIQMLLYPGSKGVPVWESEYHGERLMMKCPVYFEEIFKTPRPLDEDHGEAMARWAEGDAKPAKGKKATEPPLKLSDKDLGNALDRIAAADDWTAVEAVIADTKPMPWTTDQRNEIKAAINARRVEMSR